MVGVGTGFFEISSRNWRARLAISVDVMREWSRHTDPNELYRVFTFRMNQLFPTSRHLLIERHELGAPRFRIARDGGQAEVGIVRSGGLLAELLYADEPRVVDRMEIAPHDPAADYLEGQRSLLSIPLFEGGLARRSVILTREEPAAFPREQVPELVWMTNLFGRALRTLELSSELQSAYAAADYELRAVAELQNSLLPDALPQVEGLDIAIHYRAANRAGGDYYDFFPLPDGRLGILIADVSGHGTHAAVLMAITHSLAHAVPGPSREPGRMLTYLNAHLTKRYTGATGNFVTAFYAIVDPARSLVTYASAGHPSPRAATVTDTDWHPLPNPRRLPLGVAATDAEYPEVEIPFGPGDRIVLFTDGVVEATNREGERFGIERFDAALVGPVSDASTALAAILDKLDRFADGLIPADDRTLVAIRRTPLPS